MMDLGKNISQKKAHGEAGALKLNFLDIILCNKTHEAESDSGFISGFIDDQSTRDDEATPVVIWTENGTNVHCTTRLDINTWETAKS